MLPMPPAPKKKVEKPGFQAISGLVAVTRKGSENPQNKELLVDAWGWIPGQGWLPYSLKEGEGIFTLFGQGCLVAFQFRRLPDGTFTYLIGKVDESVEVDLGPPESGVETALDVLAEAEIRVSGFRDAIWDGDEITARSPRDLDGRESRLTPTQVLNVLQHFTG